MKKGRYNRKCIVPCCGYRQYNIDSKNPVQRRTLYSFPKNEESARAWAAQIPGLTYENLKKSFYVCEIHFDLGSGANTNSARKSYLRHLLNKSSIFPTLYLHDHAPNDSYVEHRPSSEVSFQNNPYSECYATTQYSDTENSFQSSFEHNLNSSYSSIRSIPESFSNTELPAQTVPVNTTNALLHTVKPIEFKTTLLDALKDLSASEKVLIDMKQEIISCSDEENRLKIEDEETNFSEEPTLYEELKDNVDYFASFLPKFWTIRRGFIENEEVLTLSKKCHVQINDSSIFINEKNIIINDKGNANFSVAGQNLARNSIFFTMRIKNIETLIQMIEKFDAAEICRGICTNDFDLNKEYKIYKDNLGLFRHNYCTLISDTKQCDFCLNYNR